MLNNRCWIIPSSSGFFPVVSLFILVFLGLSVTTNKVHVKEKKETKPSLPEQ